MYAAFVRVHCLYVFHSRILAHTLAAEAPRGWMHRSLPCWLVVLMRSRLHALIIGYGDSVSARLTVSPVEGTGPNTTKARVKYTQVRVDFSELISRDTCTGMEPYSSTVILQDNRQTVCPSDSGVRDSASGGYDGLGFSF